MRRLLEPESAGVRYLVARDSYRHGSRNSGRDAAVTRFSSSPGVFGDDDLKAGPKRCTLTSMSFDASTTHECEFPGCERLSRATPMALHLPEGDDHARIAWVCAKHSLLFYASDPEVVAWVDESEPATATLA